MTLSRARHSPLLAMLTVVCFITTILPPRPARADMVSASVSPVASPGASSAELYAGSTPSLGVSAGADGAVADAHVDPASGALEATIAIETPPARGAAQLGLAIHYNSNAGMGLVAHGWSLNVPAIERHNLSGAPTFQDPPSDPSAASVVPSDRMTFGGSPLVPICIVGSGTHGCSTLLVATPDDPHPEQFAASLNGYYYFRLEHETGELLRFFWSPDHATWVVQSASGITMEFGAPVGIPGDTSALDVFTDPSIVTCLDNPPPIGLVTCQHPKPLQAPYRWNLRRKYDAQRLPSGGPANLIEYSWAHHPTDGPGTGVAIGYLFDVYDTPPPSSNAAVGDYAHHVHFTYAYQNGLNNHTRIWRAGHRFALTRADVTSARFSDKTREQVRRYRFNSNSSGTVYQLTDLVVEGQCDHGTPNPTETNGLLPETGPICRTYPGNRFFYDSAQPQVSVTSIGSPFQSDTSFLPTIVDVNGDGLPDFISRSATGTGTSVSQAIALNPGTTGSWTLSTMSFVVTSPLGADPGMFSPANPSYVSGNWAGDGHTNVLWIDQQATTQNPAIPRTSNDVGYEIYSPISSSGMWAWNWPVAGTGTFNLKAHMALNPLFQRDSRMPDTDSGGPPVYASCGSGIYTKHTSISNNSLVGGMDVDWGLQSKFMTADIDGDGFSDIVTSRPLINSSCHLCTGNGLSGNRSCCKFEGDGKTPSGEDTTEWFGYACQEDVLETNRYFVQQTTRQPDGTIKPFASQERGFCVNGNNRTEEVLDVSRDGHNPHWSSFPHGAAEPHSLLDLNGDGIADWVHIAKDQMTVSLGHGNGSFGTCNDGSLDCANVWAPLLDHAFSQMYLDWNDLYAGRESPCVGGGTHADTWSVAGVPDLTKGSLHDVDADSNADFILVHDDTGSIDVYLGQGNGLFADKPISIDFVNMAKWPPSALKDVPGTRPVAVLFADMNGNGTEDIVVESGSSVAYADLYGGRPRLLSRLDNNLGVTTSVTYHSTAELDVRSHQSPAPWTTHSPQPAQVVTDVVTSNSFPTSDLTAFSFHTNYVYQNPIYDGRDRSLVGFESVAVGQLSGEQPARDAYVKTTYFNAHCGDASFPCAGSGSADYAAGAFRGLPVLTEIYDTTHDNAWGVPVPGNYLSTSHTSFDAISLYQGLDGRVVRRVYAHQSDTWIYDTTPFSSAPASSTDLTDVSYHTGSSFVSLPASFTIRSSKAQHLRSVSWLNPFHGFFDQTIDYGQIDAGGRTLDDSTIETSVTMDLAPGSDTKWIWRPTVKTVTGHDAAGNAVGTPRSTFSTYDSVGNLQNIASLLYGALPLVRFHATQGADFAKDPPPNASNLSATRVVFGQYLYSASGTGQVTRATKASGRCTEFDYDPLYEQLLVKRRVPLNGCDAGAPTTTGTNQLITQITTWNRGLGIGTTSIAPSGASKSLTLDGLGRVETIAQPNPLIPGASTVSTTIDYGAWAPIQHVHTTTAQGYEAWSYVDGLGRDVLTVTKADANDDKHPYIVSGQVRYNGLGLPVAAYQPWFSDAGASGVALTTPTSSASQTTYDRFGRVAAVFALDGSTQVARFDYKGLTTNAYDGSQIAGVANADHVGAYSFSVRDGHGRPVVSGSAGKDSSGAGTSISTVLKYQPSGEVTNISRAGNYTRSMQYDSWGRLVQNMEPNTSVGFDPSGQSPNSSAWRYAYDNDGHLVGTSDARGCGKNLWYDGADRLVAEDYSPCLASQPPYSRPILDGAGRPNGDNTEAFYVYDRVDGAGSSMPAGTLLPSGQLNEIYDRASHTTYLHDARGRVTSTVRSLAKPGEAAPLLSNRYTPHPFQYDAQYDDANRITDLSSGADVPGVVALDGPEAGSSWVHLHYSPTRGTLRSVGSSYGDLVTSLTYAADGPLQVAKLNDAAKTIAEFGYDPVHRWLSSIYVHRDSVAPTVLDRTTLVRDNVGRPKSLLDSRIPLEWTTPGSQTVSSRSAIYDDFGHLTSTDARYGTASLDDTWSNPNAAVAHAPPLPVTPANRVRHQEFTYSPLGDLTSSDDLDHAFLDRSFGTGAFGSANAGPNQLQGSTAVQLPGEAAAKSVNLFYDRAGNVSGIDDGQKSLIAYDWDEVGLLHAATRWDYVAHKPKPTKPPSGGPICTDDCPPPPGITYTIDQNNPAIRLRYAYDASGQRVLRSAVDAAGNPQWTNAEVFASLRLNHATWNTTTNDYDRTSSETAYLFAGGTARARVLNAQYDPVTGTSGHQHVFFELTDHLGSSSTIIDKDTGELVEHSTYLAYGGAESDYRPSKWANFREDYRFTGKESDVEVGLVYFGARYYSPGLGRFVSPDPLTIHAAAGDLNPYAYVRGNPFGAVDPLGLDECDKNNQTCTNENPPITPPPCNSDLAECDGGRAVGAAGGGGGGGDGRSASHGVHPASPAEGSTAVRVTLTPKEEENLRADEAHERLERAIDRQLAVADNWRTSQHQAMLQRLDVATPRRISPLGVAAAVLSVVALASVPKEGSTYVYQLVDEGGEPVYYGITNDPARRLAEHALEGTKPFSGMQVISEGQPLAQAQALETSLIQQAHAEGRLLYNLAPQSISPFIPVQVPSTVMPSQTLLNPALYPR